MNVSTDRVDTLSVPNTLNKVQQLVDVLSAS